MPKRAPKKASRVTARSAPKAAPRVYVRKVPTVTPGGPTAGVYTAPQKRARRETHPLIGADVAVVGQAILSACAGRPAKLQDTYDDMLDRDDRVGTVTRTRLLAITGRPFSVKPPIGLESDAEAKKIAANIATILPRIKAGRRTNGSGGGWQTVLTNVADGVPRGYSWNELEWGVSPEGWNVPLFVHWRHPNRIALDDTERLCKADTGDGFPGIPLETFGPDRFVIHAPTAGRPAYFSRRGALLSTVFPSLTKRTDVRLWLQGTERWGNPLLAMELPTNQQHMKDDALTMLNNMASNWVGVLWGEAKLAQVPGSGGINPAIYKDLADFCNTSIAIAMLGNNLSTEIQGGSLAAAKTSVVMRYDYLAADLAELDECITAQIIEPIVRYNWPGAPVPRYESEIEQQQPLTIESVNAGLASPDEFRSSLGWEPMADGKGKDFRAPMVPVAADLGTPTPDVLDGADPATPAAETALNGAQVTAMQGIIESAAANKIPRETAIALLTTAFPIDEAKANAILSNIQQGFVPTPDAGKPPATPPLGGADADAPLPTSSEAKSATSTSPTYEHSRNERRLALLKSLDA